MRSMGDPDFRRSYWTQERREAMSEKRRRAWGAPDGHATLYGIHIPLEHRGPLRYWADWCFTRGGQQAAVDFVLDAKSQGWANMPSLRAMWEEKLAIAENRKMIRMLESARHED